MKKAFDQTMREIKREVNKKVLKVSSIEQKVLDSTTNEPWGPHGSLLADIAQATRNYNDYQIIMAVIWKRINDTGKNWRHVYKALTVLEYLVAHGSERVIDEIREHAHQINTLSDFQYIDSSGRDQGSNVRKKSQCLVVLVNDKERMQEVRQKASAKRDKFRSVSMGSVTHPSSYSSRRGYDEGRYGSKDDDQIGYWRERGWSHKERYDRSYDEGDNNYAYSDSDYRGSGTSQSMYEYSNGTRSRSFDRGREIACDGSGQHSSRGGGARAEECPENERDVETSLVPDASTVQGIGAPENNEVVGLSEIDPHASLPAEAAHDATSTAAGPEIDLLGSLVESFSSNPLALVPAGSLTTASQGLEDPFGGEPFKVIPSLNGIAAQPLESVPSSTQNLDVPQPAASHISSQDIDILAHILPPSRSVSQSEPPIPNYPIAFLPQSTQQALHIHLVSHQSGLTAQHGWFPSHSGQASLMTGFAAQPGQQLLQTSFQTTHVDSGMWFSSQTNHQPPSLVAIPAQAGFVGGYNVPAGPPHSFPHSMSIQTGATTTNDHNNYNNAQSFISHHHGAQVPSQMSVALQFPKTQTASTVSPLAIQPLSQPAKEKLEIKSTVWSDTLNRGLVNLNISGPKTNPLADIGMDFEAMNRKEKLKVNHTNTTGTPSVITMGKAMGCGSGMGRAGAGSLRPPQTIQMVGAHTGAGISMARSYRGMNNQTMGIGMSRPMQLQQIQQPTTGFPPGPNVAGGGYYPLPGARNYGQFGGGYS
ncbi:unnamed protein product [Cuscuta epithymum]|uniref:ENTH domain-containing protein n=1 Tax=Cuscuta epithymum TaxID=186058 RepID=A0AAV0EEA3_9ASTE|nr:unnamed protein product [Cuscuta epithymum]